MTTRKRWGLWLCVVALVVLPALPAAAVLWCDTNCTCQTPCTVKCWDGYATTCGASGWGCIGQCFADAVPQAEPPAVVTPSASADTCTPAPESILDALAQP